MKPSALAFLLAFCVAPAMAADTYVGASAGRVQQKLSMENAGLSMASTGVKVFGGYQSDGLLGIEGGYMDFGKASIAAGGTSLSVKPNTFYAALTARVALESGIAAYAKLGVARPGTTGYVAQGADAEVVDTRRSTAMAGLGLSYALSRELAVVTEYEYYGKAIREAKGALKLDHLSVGLRYRF